MDRVIYTAMNGARQIMLKQATNSNNLANINTTGFRADLDAFKALPMYGPGQATRVYTENNRVGTDFSQGAVVNTGRDLDIAIDGDGFIAVQDADGNESLTRRGDLRISAEGLLTNGAGKPVLGNSGPIAIPPYQKISIGKDGTISIIPQGGDAMSMAVIDRIKLVNPALDGLRKTETGLFRTSDGEPALPDASVTISPGSLEGSNVNATEALVNMIELARQYEMHVKVMKDAEEADRNAVTIIRVNL